MKKGLYIIIGLVLLSACRDSVVKKPTNLIPKSKMEDIIYDLALLEAIQNTNPSFLEKNNINPYNYVFLKYEIDSIRLAESNKYYAANVKEYNKMYEKVKQKIESEKALADSSKVAKTKEPVIKNVQEKVDSMAKPVKKLMKTEAAKGNPKEVLE